MAGGDGDHIRRPAAVQVFAGPVIDYVEIFVHNYQPRVFSARQGGPSLALRKKFEKNKKKDNFTDNLRPIRRH
jgi:hypothetical protein